ncbi:succinate-semialdehyde dehydrogenase/glutarate-semialdehyde dehydrogenase [Brevibacterium sanguinis]|uniref:Succinate-semialdehyde dehydrogenase/glutarate-semialdehyde dehydrogenase n=2 Tax=Brevibacterium TaxID=1696 RepID=A0A366IPU6_9MICO|nr:MULTISPECIES: succinic semialdehyde dehydrogenase [Brevibacterium]RBP67118.1 succinate-semialdehyde dehydrogenase/glutarate-semialdehyde dehydrogenase [Brevibacterium sanguinis]RBP73643.1 succinate-semialdehyde dehydrogenase/glutarate-semialdehyde dehydrogenase [Brevibacterium celere]
MTVDQEPARPSVPASPEHRASGGPEPSSTGVPATARSHLTPRLEEFLDTSPYREASGSGDPSIGVEPFTGLEISRFRTNTATDVDRAFASARIAARAWAARTPAERARVLMRLHSALRRHEDLLLDIVQYETGKARIHAYDEILDTYNVCRHYAVTAPRLLRPVRRRGAVPGLTRTEVDRPPLGVVGFITPWNYPLTLGATDLFAALAAGNAVVHKPDSQTTLTAIAMRRLAVAAGLPEDVWQLVPGEVDEVGPALLANADGLSFTGSTAAGRRIAAEAGSRLLPTALELGGKNPLLVLADADIDAAVAGAIRGCFASAGQLCLSIERIYVHHSLHPEFCSRLAEAAAALELGADYDFGPSMGSLAGPRQFERVRAHVDQAVGAGARVLAGGRPVPEAGPYFYAPTVLTEVGESADLHREETFGPVVSVHPVSSDAEAVRLANESDFGLNASVFSRGRGRQTARRLEAGMVNVNEAYVAAWGSVDAPSGGVKASGLGHRHGAEGLYQFTRARTIAEQRLVPIAPFGPLDQRGFARVMTSAFAVMRALRLR